MPPEYEQGARTAWDMAHSEGRAWVYRQLLDCTPHTAHRLARARATPAGRGVATRLARWWLRRTLTPPQEVRR